jgi:carbamoyltransferase
LLKGDEIIVAIQEERLTRRKRAALYGAHPSRAIEYCLEYAEIKPRDLSLVVSCVTGPASIPEQDVSLNPILQIRRNEIPLLYIPHHFGHAISVFAISGFEESAILVVDGAGSPVEDLSAEEKAAMKWKNQNGLESISLYAASGVSIKPLEKHMMEPTQQITQWVGAEQDRMPAFWSLGGMYHSTAVQIFGEYEAGKVMGLAPYGTPEIDASEYFEIDNGRFVFHDKVPNRFRHTDRWPLRRQEYSNLASSTQAALEKGILYLVSHLYDLCPSDNLCYAGGVALNCITNERIIRESPFRNVFIAPAAEDCGTAIGAAYYGLWQLTKNNTKRRLLHDNVGPVYSERQIRGAAKYTAAVEITSSENVISDAVDLLCAGNIIGWLDGRSELGPRALGQRSILCDPRRPDAKDTLNNRVKHRESFRPFAPVVLFDHVKDWFELDGAITDSPFMLRICRFREDKKDQVPGVVHVDHTGRLQTVTPEANGRLYLLVKKFYEKTGVPIILNTSFNVAGEPIVETPRDALNTFLSTGIDYCVLGDMIVGKRKEILFEKNEKPWPERIKHQISAMLNSTIFERNSESTVAAAPNYLWSLKDFTGIYEHDIQGALLIEEEGPRLKATMVGGMASLLYGKLSMRLKAVRQGVFEATDGKFSGTRIVFLPDIRGRVNLLAVVPPKAGSIGDIYFRKPEVKEINRPHYNRLTGEYRDSDDTLIIEMQDDKLIASTLRQSGFELTQSRENEFILYRMPGYAVEFITDNSGVATAVTVVQPSAVKTLKRCE